jgi:hypothetical protein
MLSSSTSSWVSCSYLLSLLGVDWGLAAFFIFGIWCHYWKVLRLRTVCGDFAFVGVMGVSYLIACTILYLLEWDKPMSMCAMYILYAQWFFLIHMLNFVCYHVLIRHFDSIWTTWMICDVIRVVMVYVFFFPNCISLDLGRLVHACLIYVYHHALLALYDPIYKGNSIKPLTAKMCIIFKFISICTYLSGVCPMYCSYANYFGPNKIGDQLVLKVI